MAGIACSVVPIPCPVKTVVIIGQIRGKIVKLGEQSIKPEADTSGGLRHSAATHSPGEQCRQRQNVQPVSDTGLIVVLV